MSAVNVYVLNTYIYIHIFANRQVHTPIHTYGTVYISAALGEVAVLCLLLSRLGKLLFLLEGAADGSRLLGAEVEGQVLFALVLFAGLEGYI